MVKSVYSPDRVNRLKIISTKPSRQQIFVRLGRVGKQYGVATFWVRRARFSMFLLCKSLGFRDLTGWFWVASKMTVRGFVSGVLWRLRNVRFGWVVEINVRGNAYLWRRWRIKKLKRSALMVRAGFFYNLLVILPTTLRLFWHKSYIRLFSASIGDLTLIAEYLRFTRDLFPYKIGGFIFEEERFEIKPGKKRKNNR